MMKLAPTLTLAVMAVFSTACAHAHPAPAKYVSAAKVSASGWHLNANRCPDLVEDRLDRREDRRDARVVTGVRDVLEDRRDRAENRRDEAVINCPASAWVWKGARYNAKVHPVRPAKAVVYYNARTAQYYRRVNGRTVIIKL